MPKQAKRASRGLPSTTFVLDNGAYTMKAGVPGSSLDPPTCRIVPNCIARSREKRIYIGAELDSCEDFGEMIFRRPVEKGFLVNWEGEKCIWDRTFFDTKLISRKVSPSESTLILTEAPNCPHQLQLNTDQIVFEEYKFGGYYRCIGSSLNAYNDLTSLFKEPQSKPSDAVAPAECLLVIDSGYSHTTITPLLNGRPVQHAIRRLDIGGKLLTNYLKELISLRHYGMMDETHLVNEIKEDACFVTSNFSRDLERTWKGGLRDHREVDTSMVVDYVLPDYTTRRRGFVRPHDPSHSAKMRRLGAGGPHDGPREDVVPLGNERFVVPELLFNPADIGMQEAGIVGMVFESLSQIPPSLWQAMLGNVLIVGGNTKIQGFTDRFRRELREIAPSQYVVRVAVPDDPIKSSWLGGARLASSRENLEALAVTRQEYEEHGPHLLSQKFSNRIK
ncbi:actin family [Lineolata rhizophorae]|uniref:Actin-like protein ARP6 n=1 Tax=Lineolata rhizophorae TaxID=578093 RepID=A0A6A6P1F4_9PEZI|nr:actin family [Lineolata rhizophorae]